MKSKQGESERDMNMIKQKGEILEILRKSIRRHLSQTTTELVISRACGRCGLRPALIQKENIPHLIEKLIPSLELYLNPAQIKEVLPRFAFEAEHLC